MVYVYSIYVCIYIYICIYDICICIYSTYIYICRYVYIIGKGCKPFAKWDAPPSRLLRGRLEWVAPSLNGTQICG